MKSRFLKRVLYLSFVSLVTLTLFSCKGRRETQKSDSWEPQIIAKAVEDSSSIFYANFSNYPSEREELPIGMFDSGTGGLTVMEQFLASGLFNNEKFIYLADQANMPYGVYSSEGKERYLRELVVKDALFLTTPPNRVKIIVIACNTATAYGLGDVEKLLERSGTDVKVVGVINAGVEGALSTIPSNIESFAVGVLATEGTIASEGYQNRIYQYGAEKNYNSDIRVVAQGGKGFAEAVDSEPDYISVDATGVRENYRGPKWEDSLGVRASLLPLYNFDYSSNALLIERGSEGNIKELQLNSTGNYARFHMVTLLDKHRRENPGVKLRSVILGCTHYPYLLDTLKKVIEELKEYSVNGEKPFAELIAERVEFIDPAYNTAKECHRILMENTLLSKSEEPFSLEPYISLPHPNLDPALLEGASNLSFNFKYGRELNDETPSVVILPFSKENINRENLNRIKERLPFTYSLIEKSLQ